MILDPQTGKYRGSRLFVLTLGYSRKCVRLLPMQSSSRIWAELHERAFRKLGGATKTVGLDNLREGVVKADWYDPELNPLYRDVLTLRRGRAAVPAVPPEPKGKAAGKRDVRRRKAAAIVAARGALTPPRSRITTGTAKAGRRETNGRSG